MCVRVFICVRIVCVRVCVCARVFCVCVCVCACVCESGVRFTQGINIIQGWKEKVEMEKLKMKKSVALKSVEAVYKYERVFECACECPCVCLSRGEEEGRGG